MLDAYGRESELASRQGAGRRIAVFVRHWILALATVLASAPAAAAPDADALVERLQQTGYGARAHFARLALDELMLAYTDQVERSGRPQRLAGDKTDLRPWRAATLEFVERLRALRERVDFGAPVQVVAAAGGGVTLFIDREPVMLSGPDLRGLDTPQQSVAARFCAAYDCSSPAAAGGGEGHAVFDDGDAAPHWSFAQDRSPALVAGEGVRFVYADLSQREEKEQRSRQVMAELRNLVRVLRVAYDNGRELDWERMSLVARGNGALERVRINGHGEQMFLSMPILARTPGFWRQTRPWVRAQVEGRPYTLTVHETALTAAADGGWIGAGR